MVAEAQSNIFRTRHNPCIYKCAIFRTMAYLEPEVSSKVCGTYGDHLNSELQHSQNSLFKHFQGYLDLFKDISVYSPTLTDAKLGREGRPPCPSDCDRLWVQFFIKNVVSRVSRRKNPKMFPCGPSFSCVFDKMLIEVPQLHNPPPFALKNFWLRTCTHALFLFEICSILDV